MGGSSKEGGTSKKRPAKIPCMLSICNNDERRKGPEPKSYCSKASRKFQILQARWVNVRAMWRGSQGPRGKGLISTRADLRWDCILARESICQGPSRRGSSKNMGVMVQKFRNPMGATGPGLKVWRGAGLTRGAWERMEVQVEEKRRQSATANGCGVPPAPIPHSPALQARCTVGIDMLASKISEMAAHTARCCTRCSKL